MTISQRERAHRLTAGAQFRAGHKKPPTRAQARHWLAPCRKALCELLNGEVDSHRGYAITRINHLDNDFARTDHAINGFVALMDRLMADFNTAPFKRLSKKLEAGILLTPAEVNECLALLKTCEDRLIKITREKLIDAANTEMINIELERHGVKEAA